MSDEADIESLDHPVDNAPVRAMSHKGLTIEGYSRAAVQSYWRIPEMKLGFDLGLQPWSFMSTPNWFLSHTHLDHVAALPVYVSRRRLMKMEPPTIYMPADAVADVERLLSVFQRLDRGRLPATPRRPRTRPGSRTLPRAGRHRPAHEAHPHLARLPGLGAPKEAQARVPGTLRRADPRHPPLRRRRLQRDPPPPRRLPGRYLAPRARQ